MPESIDSSKKTHVFNANWSGQASPRPVNPYLSTHDDSGEDHAQSFPKKLFKISALIFCAITLIFVILASVNAIMNKNTNSSASGDNTLTYWGITHDESVMKDIISDFEKENNNIKVEYTKVDPQDYRERLTTRIKNGTGPDVFSFHNSWYSMISDILSPLPSGIFDKNDIQKDFYPIVEDDLVKNGKVYGLPLEIDTLALFVNTKIFSDGKLSYPNSWQQFKDDATALTKRDDQGRIVIAGAAMGTYDNIDHAPDIISLLFAQEGVDLQDIQKSKSKVEDAIQYYKLFSLVSNSVWDATLDKSLLAFSQGKVAMVFGYASDFVAIKKQNPSLAFKVVPAPQLLQSNKKNIGSYWVEGISSKSKKIDAAQKFIEYLSRPNVMEKIYQEESAVNGYGKPFPLKALGSKIQDVDYQVFLNQAPTAVSTPFVDATFDNGINDNLSNLLKNAISSDNFGKLELDKLFQGYSQVVGKYSTGL